MNKFAERLKELRKLNKITQKQVALKTAIAERVYQSYEYGKVIPTATTLITLADYFNVSLDYLVGRSDIKERR
jgi:transcriptional regulator with XRE-family HTH domain